MSEKLNIKLLLLTDVVLDKNLLERRRDAARILAMLLAEEPTQRYSGGSDILLQWTKPLTQNGDKKNIIHLMVILLKHLLIRS